MVRWKCSVRSFCFGGNALSAVSSGSLPYMNVGYKHKSLSNKHQACNSITSTSLVRTFSGTLNFQQIRGKHARSRGDTSPHKVVAQILKPSLNLTHIQEPKGHSITQSKTTLWCFILLTIFDRELTGVFKVGWITQNTDLVGNNVHLVIVIYWRCWNLSWEFQLCYANPEKMNLCFISKKL